MKCGRISRSEEHTSELQSLTNLVCRLLLEKKTPESTRTGPCRAATVSSGDAAKLCWRAEALAPTSKTARRQRRDEGLWPAYLFFFKGAGAPRDLPFSPPGGFPV